MSVLGRLELIDQAVEQSGGLKDFGDMWFFANIDAFIEALNGEARLNPEGEYGAQASIVGALVNRLRHVDLVKRNPEILDEKINVAAVVSGLPRTGSTMLHRMLASAPGMTGIKWFETQNYSPFPGEVRGKADSRREAAKGILDYMLMKMPELMSIHPMSIEQPDEEVIIMGQLFSSTMQEASYYVPSYAKWLSEQDDLPAYKDLYQIFQSLQWQDPEREGKRWVLKTPGHLIGLEALAETFSDAKIVMTHRDPVATVPSYCSMEATLYKLGSDEISHEMVGGYWPNRLKEWLDSFMAARKNVDPSRFVDVDYRKVLENPIEQGSHVLQQAGITVSDDTKDGMSEWIEANRREHRAPHKYSLEDFGVTESQIEDMFADYRAQYIF